MTPTDLRSARKRLGLSTNGLAEALRLGKGGGRTVRRWEAGEVAITGPAQVAIEYMLGDSEEKVRDTVRRTGEQGGNIV